MILVTKCTRVTLGRPAERPQVQNGSLRMQLPPWTKRSSLTCRLSSPALSYALRRESLLCTHVPSPPPEAGGLNLTLGLCAWRALSGELRTRVGAGLRDQGVRNPERRRGGFPHLDASSCPPPLPPPPSVWGWRRFAARAGEQLQQESRDAAAAQRSVGSSGCSGNPWPPPGVRSPDSG